MKSSFFRQSCHHYRCIKLRTISVFIISTLFFFSFISLSQTITLSYTSATSNNNDEGTTSSPSQTISNDNVHETDISDKRSPQDLTIDEDNNKKDPSKDSDLQTLNGNLFEEKPIDDTLLRPPIEGIEEFPANTDLYTTNGYLTIETRAVNYTPDMKPTIDSVSVCVQTQFVSEDNLVYSMPANPNCSIGVDTTVTYTVHPGQVSLSITNVGAKFTTYEKDCLITVEPAESRSCEIAFIGNPVLMDLEDRPSDIDIIKK